MTTTIEAFSMINTLNPYLLLIPTFSAFIGVAFAATVGDALSTVRK